MYGSETSASASEIRVVSSQTAGRPSGVSTPPPLGDLVHDRLRDLVAGAQGVRELRAVGVQEDGAVGTRGLGDGVALHVLGPGAAVRVVLERIEVAGLGAEVERDPRHLAGRAGVVGGELAALLGLAKAAAPGREDHRPRLDDVLAAARSPARARRLELRERRVREASPRSSPR